VPVQIWALLPPQQLKLADRPGLQRPFPASPQPPLAFYSNCFIKILRAHHRVRPPRLRPLLLTSCAAECAAAPPPLPHGSRVAMCQWEQYAGQPGLRASFD
jgi:hypothetical protein